MNLFNTLENKVGQGVQNVAQGLNSYGIQTPNLGISHALLNAGSGQNNGNGLNAFAPYGLTPTYPQQVSIAQNPYASTLADISPPGSGPQEGPPVPTPGITPTPSSSSGPGTPSYYLHNQTVNGVTYNLADPAQQELLRQAQLSNLGSARDTSINQLNQGVQNNLSQAQLQDAQALGTYNQNAADYGRSLANNVVNLGQGYNLGQVNNQQQFAGLSPNAFQSSQATSQQYGTDQYNKGLTQLQQQQAENVGSNYLQNGQIDPNSAIGKMIAAENGNYNLFATQENQALQNGTQAANVAYGQGADQVASNLQNLNAYAGAQQPSYTSVGYDYNAPSLGAYSPYQTPGGNPYTVPTTNIGQYTPYTSAAQLAQSPQAQSPSPATWTGSSNPFSGLLGYTPNATQSNFLNAFAGQSAAPATATGS